VRARLNPTAGTIVRILLVTDWTADDGGIEVYVTRAAHGLRSAGHEVRLLTSSVAPAGRQTADYVALGSDNPVAQTFLQIANPFALGRMREAVREFRPDVVQVNMFEKYLSPSIFQALRTIPTVALVHYSKPVCPTALKWLPNGSVCRVPAGLVCWRSGCVGLAEWLRDRPRYALIRSGLARSAKVLACSRWMVEQLGQAGIRADSIALPVPQPSPEFAREPAPEPLFVYCGRLTPEKGVDVLLHAFAQVVAGRPAARLWVVGGGPRLAALQGLAERLGLGHAVRFQGRSSFAEFERVLSQAWALVAPSVWPEPLGLTAIEAITRGVPAITTAAGGLAETVEPGVSGALVPNGDERALAECLLEAVDHGPLAIPEHVVMALRNRHDPERHTALLTAEFQAAIEARGQSVA
jgi:glycosyltransferase involved in cell wall biosynthesis